MTAPSLTVCSLVNCPPGQFAAALEPLRPLGAEVVLAIDERMDPSFDAGYREIADRAVRVPYLGAFSHVFAWIVSLCSGDWILQVDADEVPSAELAGEVAKTVRIPDITHAWIPRHWLFPDAGRYLAQWPWRPDYSLRLFRNDPALLSFPGGWHEPVRAVGPCHYLGAPVYHADLLLQPFPRRLAKCRRYEEARPGMSLEGMPFNSAFYLPELRASVATERLPRADVDVVGAYMAAPDRIATGPVATPVERIAREEIEPSWEGRAIGEGAYSARLSWLDDDRRITAGEVRTFDVEVHNTGDELWPGGMDSRPRIRLAYRWLHASGEGRGVEGLRTPFGSSLAPGGVLRTPLQVRGPDVPGSYVLELDVVHEGVRWFACELRVPIAVTAPPLLASDAVSDPGSHAVEHEVAEG